MEDNQHTNTSHFDVHTPTSLRDRPRVPTPRGTPTMTDHHLVRRHASDPPVSPGTPAKTGSPKRSGGHDGPELTSNQKSRLRAKAIGTKFHLELQGKTMPLGAVLHILRERRKDTLYLNCFGYLVFIVLYTVVVNMHHHVFTSFAQNYGIRDVLLNEPFSEPHDLRTYQDVGEMDEWWLWFEGPFVGKIWSAEHYNGDPRDNVTEIAMVLQESYVVGAVRLRQIRTQAVGGGGGDNDAVSSTGHYDGSGVRSSSGRKFKYWPHFTPASEETRPLRARSDSAFAGHHVYRQGMGSVEGTSWDVTEKIVYGHGGYTVELPRQDAVATLATIATLKRERWLDGGTRVVAVDVNVFNPASDTITALRVTTEFLAQGLVLKIGWAFSARISLYSWETEDVLRGVLEIVVVCIVLFYIFAELRECCELGCSAYMSSIFNVLSLLNLFLTLTAMVIHVYAIFTFIHDLDLTQEDYMELYPQLEWWAVKKNLVAGTLLLGYLRLFRYLELNSRVKVLIYAMLNSLEDLVTSLLVMCILIGAFSLAGMLLFGENVAEFSGMSYSVSTLLRAIIGDFDYEQLRYFHPSIAPMFYASYVLLVLIVIFNMVIAVIIDGYEEAKNIIMHQKNEADNKAPFVTSRTRLLRQHVWLGWNEFCVKRCGRGRTALSQSVVAPARGKAARLSKLGGHTGGLDKAGMLMGGEEKQHGGEGGDGFTQSLSRGQTVVNRLASYHNPNRVRMEHLVEHVMRARETLAPAERLKALFHGDVEANFRKMYNSDVLATHALGEDSRIRLTLDDLTQILGDREVATEVISLYGKLEHSRKLIEAKNDDGEDGGEEEGEVAADAAVGAGTTPMLNVDTIAGAHGAGFGSAGGGGAGGGAGGPSPNAMAEMVRAINSLNKQVQALANVPSNNSPAPIRRKRADQIRRLKSQDNLSELKKARVRSPKRLSLKG